MFQEIYIYTMQGIYIYVKLVLICYNIKHTENQLTRRKVCYTCRLLSPRPF